MKNSKYYHQVSYFILVLSYYNISVSCHHEIKQFLHFHRANEMLFTESAHVLIINRQRGAMYYQSYIHHLQVKYFVLQ